MAQKSEDKVQNEQEPEVSEKPDQAEDWQNAIEDAPDEDIPLNDDGKDVDHTFEALLQERDQLKDQLLRALAETENMRRRTERETQSARKYGHTAFARDLVGAIDNLARAIEAAGASGSEPVAADEATQSLIKGIELSWTEILSVIEKHGITQINPVGEKFDYNQHQAMFELPTDEHEPGMVVEVVQHGYMLHDRLLRPAMVGVSKAADKPDKQVDAKA